MNTILGTVRTPRLGIRTVSHLLIGRHHRHLHQHTTGRIHHRHHLLVHPHDRIGNVAIRRHHPIRIIDLLCMDPGSTIRIFLVVAHGAYLTALHRRHHHKPFLTRRFQRHQNLLILRFL